MSFLSLFRDLIPRLNDSSSSSPPVSCILSDYFMSYTLALSEELGIPNVIFCNIAASGFLSFKHFFEKVMQYPEFIKDLTNEKDVKHLDDLIEWNPGNKYMRLRDLFNIMQASDLDKFMPNYHINILERASKAPAVVFHTFEALEGKALDLLKSLYQRVYSIGPLQLLLKNNADDYYDFLECNLWNDKAKCIEWLDSKPPNSVVYVNFGTTAVMTMEQQVQLAWGLANSNQNFLWIIREDMIIGDSEGLLQDFLLETKERGFLASWCPLEQVLNHPTVGGFVMHGGWNSTVESISAGVPMICWPFFGENFENCRNCCSEWGIGMELRDKCFTRDEVEKLVKQLIAGEKGKQMRSKTVDWKKKDGEAASVSGSSALNLNNLVKQVLLSSN